MKEILFVGAGGMVGSIMRMLVIKSNIINSNFPFNTFLVNIIGCFLVGILIKYSSDLNKDLSNQINNFLILGFCGGFTTFSAFSVDSLNLFNENKILILMMYSLLSTLLGIFSCYLGIIYLGDGNFKKILVKKYNLL